MIDLTLDYIPSTQLAYKNSKSFGKKDHFIRAFMNGAGSYLLNWKIINFFQKFIIILFELKKSDRKNNGNVGSKHWLLLFITLNSQILYFI